MKITVEKRSEETYPQIGSYWECPKGEVFKLYCIAGDYIAGSVTEESVLFTPKQNPKDAVAGLELFHGKITIDAEAT